MFNRVPGTKDVLPEQVIFWQDIEVTSRKIFSAYNYQEIRPPLIEDAALFNRSLGEATEIVQKQMFTIKREGDLYALRPEGTASIVRAYIENSLDKTRGFAKFYYLGPMFRAERPQKGRLRQFHHIGCEAIGSNGPDIDVEIIALADNLLKAYGVEDYNIVINSLGCAQDKKAFQKFLQDSLKGQKDRLCADCQDRYDRNILRVLDCKNEACQKIIAELKISGSHLCPECLNHFVFVKERLDQLKIAYQVMPTLVRGLDYYNRTVFEIKHEQLGPQQDALGAGGRYDGLVKELGGPEAGAIGFAFGFERLLLALENKNKVDPPGIDCFYIPLGEAARKAGIVLVAQLRSFASADTSMNYGCASLKSALRKANDLGARFVVIQGDDELKNNAVSLKNMQNGQQETIPVDQLKEKIKK